MKNYSTELLAITYVGSSKFGFYKDCNAGAARLKASLSKYNINLVVFTLADLRAQVRFPDSNFFYFFTRYGAGAWFWKPILINHALANYKAEYVLYLDSDCVVQQDPELFIKENLQQSDIALFKQNASLADWISPRALRLLDLPVLEARQMNLLTAGILLIRNSRDAMRFMDTWASAMKNPRILLNPVFPHFGERHRHDQAVLSALVGKGVLKCKIMTTGFHSTGMETLEKNPENAWVTTGELVSSSLPMSYLQRLQSISDFYSRKFYDVVKSCIITPIHMIFFLSHETKATISFPTTTD